MGDARPKALHPRPSPTPSLGCGVETLTVGPGTHCMVPPLGPSLSRRMMAFPAPHAFRTRVLVVEWRLSVLALGPTAWSRCRTPHRSFRMTAFPAPLAFRTRVLVAVWRRTRPRPWNPLHGPSMCPLPPPQDDGLPRPCAPGADAQAFWHMRPAHQCGPEGETQEFTEPEPDPNKESDVS